MPLPTIDNASCIARTSSLLDATRLKGRIILQVRRRSLRKSVGKAGKHYTISLVRTGEVAASIDKPSEEVRELFRLFSSTFDLQQDNLAIYQVKYHGMS